jgi:filamentous hemagglutinin
MNEGLYKLVYSKVQNMMVPVSEAARGHAVKSNRRIRQHTQESLTFTLLLSVVLVNSAWGDTVLPAGINIRAIVDNSTRVIASDANNINFQQLKPAAIVDFNQLNLGRGQNFNVDMRPTWSMLSRVHDVNPSMLNGNVNAAGNLYFVNANGIVIGKDAQFNVGSLYAGTLDITNAMFQDGFVNQESFTKAFELVGTLDLDDAARAKIENAQVLVEGGAQINAANNGKVMLFAPNVKVEENAIIRTPEGQTILAAGKKIYIKGSADPAGFLVEVDSGGTATNLGKIIADRGNITMMGLAVNQSGTLSATTSVRANGSIKLIAQDKVDVVGIEVTGRRNGQVNLTEGSVTEIKPEIADKEETIASQPFKTSEVNIEASLINIDGSISVQGGNVTANTNLNASYTASPELNSLNTRRIYLGEHASIDVSGVDAIAPMSRNQLEVQLFSDQLKDVPILRDSDLFRSTVYVDARKGTDLFDIQPFLDLRGATVAERMTNAGTVTLATNQEVIISKGATIDVSGGSTTYTAGNVRETQLLFNGKLVPISEAKPGVAYNISADTLTVTDVKWGTKETYDLGGTTRFVQSYFEGANAGTVNLTTAVDTDRASVLVLAGNLIANTRVSREQLLSQDLPQGGQLIASAKTLEIGNQAVEMAEGFTFDNAVTDAANYVSVINADFLANGFNRIDFTKVDDLTVNTALKLDSHGSLTLGNAGTDTVTRLNANITAPTSDIHFQSLTTQIADNVTVSTAGVFTNDKAGIAGALTREVAADGGSITAGLMQFGNNVKLDASAGAWVDSLGKFHTGEAGDIHFVSNQNLPSNLTLQSYGFTDGGKLSVQFGDTFQSNLNVATAHLTGQNDFTVGADFFKRGGFSEYALSAYNVNIGHGSETAQEIYVTAQNWKMNSGFLNMAGGQVMSVVAKPIMLPDYNRNAVSFSFTSNRTGDALGSVTLAENTTIRTDRGGSVSLSAGKQVNVLGDIVTPSGTINLKINDEDAFLPDDATQMVYIGEHANLSANGSVITYADSRPQLLHTQVQNAGQININQNQGAFAKGAVVIKEGAVLDVSGASVISDTKTAKGYVRETLYGDAGTININGSGAMLLDGDFSASATGTGRDGTLNLVFNPKPFNEFDPYPNNSGTFLLTENKQLTATDLSIGASIKDVLQAATPEATQYLKAQISAEQIEQAGFANVSIKSYLDTPTTSSKVELVSDLTLNIGGNLTIDTPILHVQNGGNATLNAGHITLKSPSLFVDTFGIAQGIGTLNTNSQQLYVDGLMAISGVNQTNLNAQYDIHGQGVRTTVQQGNEATDSGLIANGNMTLTARQIFPDSGAKLIFEALGSDSVVTINANAQAAKPVLSAGGILTIKANDIVQNGVLTSPFGSINLIGESSVTLTANSTTSVSANNMLIPFGTTTTGGERFNPNNDAVSRNLPDKAINIDADKVDMQQSAVLDLSAGGDMFAYEWVPGLGGSKDVLAQPDTYAVIPNYNQAFAPTDLNMAGKSASVSVGQTVYLNGVNGLAAGTYTLLPARYALVPGAFVVQLKSGTQLSPGQVSPQQDGSVLTTGYFGDVSTGARDAQFSTFSVYNGAVFRPNVGEVSKAPSQYIITSANTFFNNPLKTGGVEVNTPLDVGKLSLSATALTLNANVVANQQQEGSGLLVDISSEKIRLVNEQDETDATSLQLTADSLNSLGAESILVGGTRRLIDGTSQITTVADTVTVENDAEHTLRTTEFIAVASDKLQINAGAAIDTGTANSKPKSSAVSSVGDGALLALSSQNNISYTRQGSSASALKGEAIIANGSQLHAGNSAVVDASKNVSLNGDLELQDGGSVTLGANRILIGVAPEDIVGLNVDNQSLAALGKLSALTLNSYSNIDTFGVVNFGNQDLNLTLNSAGVVGHAGANPTNEGSVITANTLTLKNTQDATLIASTAPANMLSLNAKVVRFEGEKSPVFVNNLLSDTDKTSIQGYANLNINAGEVRVAQQGETVLDVSQVSVSANRITAEIGADYKIKATDALSTAQANNQNSQPNTLFGGKLSIEAQDLTVASNIALASGQLTLKADNDLTLADGADISAISKAIQYDTTTKHISAGQVNLISNSGNVNINNGARVDVSSQGVANAGAVKLQATQGTLNIAGQLDGTAKGSGQGGKLDVDVQTINNLSASNQQAVGFTESRSYRVRNGDVLITGTGAQTLTAREVSVTAEAGQINVSGDIVATSAKNSHIGLYAANGLTLENTANLSANSTKQGEEGGRVDLHTVGGDLNLKAGAKINVSGGLNGAGGEVHLRAPRTGAGSGTGVAVTQLASEVVGAQSTVLEAVRTFTGVNNITTGSGTGATLGFNTVANDVTSFMNNRNSILTAIAKADDSSFHLQAGTEIRSNGNLTVASDWNLYSQTRAGNEPGVLTLRAIGNIQFTGSLSDGFTTANRNLQTIVATEDTPGQGLATTQTWSYRIASGADMQSANVMNTLASEKNELGNAVTGNLILNNDKVIRTGTGFIEIATGGDLQMKNSGSVIYTVGKLADELTSFDGPQSNPVYLTNGGDISIHTQGSIMGAEPASGRQVVNQWLFRQGGEGTTSDKDTSWWIRPDLFRQSLATLGGGDITLVANGNISNFSASAPTTGRYDNYSTSDDPATNNSVVNGGGDIFVSAGGNITNGTYFVAKGEGVLNAGGAIQASEDSFGTLLALQDGRMSVNATNDAYIASTFNPTLSNQATSNASLIDRFGTNSYFNTYTNTASVEVSSVNGDVAYGNGSDVLGKTTGLHTGIANSFSYNPATIALVAHGGDVRFGIMATDDATPVVMLPAEKGQLELFASNNVLLNSVSMSDADPLSLPNVNSPVRSDGLDSLILRTLNTHDANLLHAEDNTPAMIVANSGDISSDNRVIAIPKATRFVAGNDITNLNIALQNNNSADISLIKAGRDVNTRNIVVGGPGELLVQAGRNVDLVYPVVTTINTTGNTGTTNAAFSGTFAAVANSGLPAEGASITLQAGLGQGADVNAYITRYILPSGAGPETLANDTARLAEYRANTATALTNYMRKLTGNNALSDEQALTLFESQSVESKLIFANRHLTSELIGSARDFAKADNHDRGIKAIATLFPTKNEGDILLFNSKVSTNSGGSIDLIAPGGFINVGVPGQGGDIGIITEKGGEIRAIADGDFQVNQSKVITQFGSDIAIWSTNGTIDAGRGSKTATSVPERIVQTDAFGNTVIEVRGVAAGSGIRAQSYDPDGPNGPKTEPKKGNVFLTAPTVDAGEAGIEAGDLLIVAPIVLNAANIQVQGASSGVPVAATSSLAGVSAGLSPDAVNSATQAVSQSVAQSANNSFVKPTLPSIISVDVISIGQ